MEIAEIASLSPKQLDELCAFTFGEKVTVPSKNYGSAYLPEFRDIVLTAKAPVMRALEWGTGHTTILLGEMLHRRPGHELIGIDDYEPFSKMIARSVNPSCNFKSFVCSRMGLGRSQQDPELNYASFPLSFGRVFDFVFIDGRRRMECAMHALLLAKPDATIVIHDFRRARYQAILALFDLRYETTQFRVLTPNPGIQERIFALAEKTGITFPYLVDGTCVKATRLGIFG